MYPPPSPPLPTGPSRGWYWVACLLVVGSLGALVAATLLNFRMLSEDTTTPTVADGSGAVRQKLYADVEYWIYHRENGTTVDGDGGCRVSVDGQERTVPVVDGDPPFLATEPLEEQGNAYWYVGRFTATETGNAVVTCPGLGTEWMIQRDDAGFAWLGLACCGAFLGVPLGLLVIGIVAPLRARARRQATEWGQYGY